MHDDSRTSLPTIMKQNLNGQVLFLNLQQIDGSQDAGLNPKDTKQTTLVLDQLRQG